VQRNESIRAYQIGSDIERKVIGHMGSPLTRTSALLSGGTAGMPGEGKFAMTVKRVLRWGEGDSAAGSSGNDASLRLPSVGV
jgi:hypothetical protein